jgi:hypothetical protein
MSGSHILSRGCEKSFHSGRETTDWFGFEQFDLEIPNVGGF